MSHGDGPTSSRRRRALTALLAGTAMLGSLGGLAAVTGAPFLFPSLGPTAFLLLELPDAPAASPRNSITGHALGVLAGLSSLALFGLLDAPSALEVGVSAPRALAGGLSLGMTSAAMILLRRVHPPAGATTLLVSLGLMTSLRDVGVLLAAVVLLALFGRLLRRLMTTL